MVTTIRPKQDATIVRTLPNWVTWIKRAATSPRVPLERNPYAVTKPYKAITYSSRSLYRLFFDEDGWASVKHKLNFMTIRAYMKMYNSSLTQVQYWISWLEFKLLLCREHDAGDRFKSFQYIQLSYRRLIFEHIFSGVVELW